MKASKILLVTIITVILFFWMSNAALARTNVSIGVGVGPGYYPGWSGYYGVGWGGHHHGSSVVIGGYLGGPVYYPYPYYPYPGYYVAPPPPVVVVQPPVAAAPPVAPPPPAEEMPPVMAAPPAQQGGYTESLYGPIGAKKNELLNVLATGDKEHRIKAIHELAGYSYDDNVRLALEKVLLSDTDPELRVAAATAFGEVRNPKPIPALEKARVEDPVTDVRIAADLSIKKLQGN
jgi:hypothetical protein